MSQCDNYDLRITQLADCLAPPDNGKKCRQVGQLSSPLSY